MKLPRGALPVGLAALLAAMLAAAQQEDESETESGCRPDELDVGDYCVGQPEPRSPTEARLQRQTPFRIRSMMPGHADRGMMPGRAARTPAQSSPGPRPRVQAQPEPAPRAQAQVAAQVQAQTQVQVQPEEAIVEAGAGYGLQLGAFSQRATAERVVADAHQRFPGPYRIAPLARGERILWAVIHGPFPTLERASAARARVISERAYQGAILKSLAELELILPTHAPTQE